MSLLISASRGKGWLLNFTRPVFRGTFGAHRVPIRCASYTVEVYLLQDVNGLGKQGQVVEVKPGYARHSLLPNNMAILMGEGPYQKKLPILHEQQLSGQKVVTTRQIGKEVRKWLDYEPMTIQSWLSDRNSIVMKEQESTAVDEPASTPAEEQKASN